MDERTTHEDDTTLDNDQDDLESDELIDDDDSTPADTDDESDEPKKETAEDVRERQKKSWLDKIRTGKKSLDDMPENLGWLKKEIISEVEPKKETSKQDGNDIESRVRKALQEERAADEFEFLISDLESSSITAEQEATLKEEYTDLLSDFSNPTATQRLKALVRARKLAGIKDNATVLQERKRKGMSLPPIGGRKRSTVQKDQMTEIEKRLAGNLPRGFKA